MRVSMPWLSIQLLELGAPDARLGVDDDREHVPAGLDAVGEAREREQVGPPGEVRAGEREVALATGEVVGELVELHEAEGGRQLGRLEVPADLVEDEEVVVLEAVVDGAEEALVDALASEPKSCTSERRPQRRSSSAWSARSSSSKHTMPPVPAAVMMCERAKLVSADVGAGAGGRAPQGEAEGVARVLDHEQAVAVGDGADGVPVGALPMRFGARIALVRGPIIASMASTSIWKVSGVTSTNAGTSPAADHRRDVGGEGDGATVTISSPGSRPSTSMAR